MAFSSLATPIHSTTLYQADIKFPSPFPDEDGTETHFIYRIVDAGNYYLAYLLDPHYIERDAPLLMLEKTAAIERCNAFWEAALRYPVAPYKDLIDFIVFHFPPLPYDDEEEDEEDS